MESNKDSNNPHPGPGTEQDTIQIQSETMPMPPMDVTNSEIMLTKDESTKYSASSPQFRYTVMHTGKYRQSVSQCKRARTLSESSSDASECTSRRPDKIIKLDLSNDSDNSSLSVSLTSSEDSRSPQPNENKIPIIEITSSDDEDNTPIITASFKYDGETFQAMKLLVNKHQRSVIDNEPIDLTQDEDDDDPDEPKLISMSQDKSTAVLQLEQMKVTNNTNEMLEARSGVVLILENDEEIIDRNVPTIRNVAFELRLFEDKMKATDELNVPKPVLKQEEEEELIDRNCHHSKENLEWEISILHNQLKATEGLPAEVTVLKEQKKKEDKISETPTLETMKVELRLLEDTIRATLKVEKPVLNEREGEENERIQTIENVKLELQGDEPSLLEQAIKKTEDLAVEKPVLMEQVEEEDKEEASIEISTPTVFNMKLEVENQEAQSNKTQSFLKIEKRFSEDEFLAVLKIESVDWNNMNKRHQKIYDYENSDNKDNGEERSSNEDERYCINKSMLLNQSTTSSSSSCELPPTTTTIADKIGENQNILHTELWIKSEPTEDDNNCNAQYSRAPPSNSYDLVYNMTFSPHEEDENSSLSHSELWIKSETVEEDNNDYSDQNLVAVSSNNSNLAHNNTALLGKENGNSNLLHRQEWIKSELMAGNDFCYENAVWIKSELMEDNKSCYYPNLVPVSCSSCRHVTATLPKEFDSNANLFQTEEWVKSESIKNRCPNDLNMMAGCCSSCD